MKVKLLKGFVNLGTQLKAGDEFDCDPGIAQALYIQGYCDKPDLTGARAEGGDPPQTQHTQPQQGTKKPSPDDAPPSDKPQPAGGQFQGAHPPQQGEQHHEHDKEKKPEPEPEKKKRW